MKWPNKLKKILSASFYEKGVKMKSFENNYLKLGVIIIAMLVFFSLVVKPIYAGIKISDEMKSCVVAVGFIQYKLNEETGIIEEEKKFRGTGVLVNADRYILVTAKHVIFDKESKLLIPNLCYWGNKQNGDEFIHSFAQTKYKYPKITWVVHKERGIDIALSIIEKGSDEKTVFVGLGAFGNIAGIEKGDDVCYLGYPFGLGAEHGSDPVLRKGMVAHKEKEGNIFYVDAVVTDGNSGGPVFIETDGKAKLVGIISGFIPSIRKEGVFHSGLGQVFSVDCINDILKSPEYEKTR
jgi:S1-C subfamily serine protease